VAKRKNAATKVAVEEFIESRTPMPAASTPTFDVAAWRRGEEASMQPFFQFDATPNYNAAAATAASDAEKALLEAEYLAKLAKEGEERAKIQADLDASDAARKAAEEAARLAKEAADKAAAEAARLAAEEKARLEALLAKAKADADAAAARAAQAALDALNRASAAAGNINTAGNVFMPGTPAAGGMGAADILARQYAEQQAAREKEQQMQRQSIMDVLTDRFTRYNLTGLIPTIKRLAQEGATESTITLLTPAEYLNLEDGYRQTLRAYGLNQFDTDDYVSQFIANDMSAAELSNRVVTAVQRVRNADPAVAATLRDYYGIGDSDLVAYVLDPSQQFQKIERQVAASEIGTAARRQGIQAGVGVAEQLAAQGITQAEAQRGYATIANVLPGAEKLSQLYGSTLEGYGLAEAEQEVFNSLASAQRRRQRLTEREIAEFGGTSGTGRSSLSQQSRGQF